MKTEKLLECIRDAGELTILDADGKKLGTIQAKELQEMLGNADDPERFCRDLLEEKESNVPGRAAELGLPYEARRGVFLLELQQGGAEECAAAAELLKQLYPQESGDVIVTLNSHSLLLLHSLGAKKEAEQMKSSAEQSLSLINTELMLKMRVSYGMVISELTELRKAFSQAQMAMAVMKIFYGERLVMDYASLGVGGLIHDLGIPACERFLEECFGAKRRSRMGEEELQMVNRFFERDLNISETARDLYLHRNTLVYHLEKVQKKTGLDIRHFDDAMRLKLALMIESYVKYRENA